MENFKIDNTVDFSKLENVERLVKEHEQFMESKFVKPQQDKVKELEAKVSAYEDEKLFSGVKNDKHKSFINDLLQSDKYKSMPRQEAFNKINEDYKDFLAPAHDPTGNDGKTPNDKSNDIGKTILDLHKGTDPADKLEQIQLEAKTKGIDANKNPDEMDKLVSMAKADALKNVK